MSTDPLFRYREGDRAAFIEALRELANYLVRTPALPVPRYPSLILNVIAESDEARRIAVTRVARLLDVPLREDDGEFLTVRRFGPIEYKAWASTLAGDAAWQARRSYCDAVRP